MWFKKALFVYSPLSAILAPFFKTNSNIATNKIPIALNTKLKRSIRIINAEEVIDVSSFLVHAEDLIQIVNELFNLGADAVAINGKRRTRQVPESTDPEILLRQFFSVQNEGDGDLACFFGGPDNDMTQ